MSNRLGKTRPGQHTRNPVKAQNTNSLSAKIGAKTADINLFSDLLREKSRLNERTTEQQYDETYETTHSSAAPNNPDLSQQSIDSDIHARPANLSRHGDNSQQQLTTRPAQQFDISVKPTIVAEGTAQVTKVDIQPLVAVMQRIIVNHMEVKEPKQWLIRLTLNDQRSIEISLECLGKNEWRIGMREDDHKNDSHKNDIDDTPWLENLDELYVRIEADLMIAQPSLRISPLTVQGPG